MKLRSNRPRIVAAIALLLASSVSVAAFAQEGVRTEHGQTESAAKGGEHAKQEHAKEEAEEEGPPPINWVDFGNKETPPYLALFINFAVLAFIYYRFGKKPVAEALAKQRAAIAKEIEEAQKMKHEAEARAKTYQAKLQDLDAELQRTRLALEEAGKGERERIVKDAAEKAARMEKDAAFMLEQEAKQVRLDLQREAALAALAAAGDLLKKRVTQSDQERLAEEFLTSLEQHGSPGRAKSSGQVPSETGGES